MTTKDTKPRTLGTVLIDALKARGWVVDTFGEPEAFEAAAEAVRSAVVADLIARAGGPLTPEREAEIREILSGNAQPAAVRVETAAYQLLSAYDATRAALAARDEALAAERAERLDDEERIAASVAEANEVLHAERTRADAAEAAFDAPGPLHAAGCRSSPHAEGVEVRGVCDCGERLTEALAQLDAVTAERDARRERDVFSSDTLRAERDDALARAEKAEASLLRLEAATRPLLSDTTANDVFRDAARALVRPTCPECGGPHAAAQCDAEDGL